MTYKLVEKETGSKIIDEWCKGQDNESYEFTSENTGSFIFQDGEIFIGIINETYSECNVEEFDTLEKAVAWINGEDEAEEMKMKNSVYVLVTDFENEQYEIVGTFKELEGAKNKADEIVSGLVEHWSSREDSSDDVSYDFDEHTSEDGIYSATYQVEEDFVTISQTSIV